MSKRDEVIEHLKEMADYFRECRQNVSFASKAENHFWEMQNAANELIGLLKEQEEKKFFVDSDGKITPLPDHEMCDLLKEQKGKINELQNVYGYLQKQLFEAQDKLLKVQEAVEPVEGSIKDVLLCGKCKSSLMREEGYRFRHCPWCGKKVKWD